MTSSAPNNSRPVPEAPPENRWAFRIGSVAGIPIYLHATFLLFMIWLGLGSVGNDDRRFSFLFVMAVFACVVLHELGHALTALRFKIPVASITLYPIGGIARIEKQPTPAQELWIALAGPAVNIIIAGILEGYLAATGSFAPPDSALVLSNDWVKQIVGANFILALFNLIPAFPMDGGRVLRAILGFSMPFERATAVAASVGQGLAMLAGLLAILTGNWMLLIIAFFIFMGAGQEATVAHQTSLIENATVQEAMVTDLRTLPHGATFREASEVLLATSQQDFPVLLGEEVVGLLPRDALLRGFAREGEGAYVASAMVREFHRAHPNDDLTEALRQMQSGSGPLLVFEDDRLVGMVTMENLMEFLVIREITTKTSPPPPAHQRT